MKRTLLVAACALFAANAQARSPQTNGGTVSPDAYGSGTSTTSNDCAQQPPDIGKSSGCLYKPRKTSRMTQPTPNLDRMNPDGPDSTTMNGPSSDGTAAIPNTNGPH